MTVAEKEAWRQDGCVEACGRHDGETGDAEACGKHVGVVGGVRACGRRGGKVEGAVADTVAHVQRQVRRRIQWQVQRQVRRRIRWHARRHVRGTRLRVLMRVGV